MSKKIQYLLEYFVMRGIIFSLFPLSSEIKSTIIKNLLKLIKPRKNLIKKQLKMVFSDKDEVWIDKVVLDFYSNLATLTTEFFLTNWDTISLESKNRENLLKAFSFGKGVILVSGHIGNWELGMREIAKEFPVNAIVKSVKNPFVDNFINNTRKRGNVKIIYLKNLYRKVFEAIKKNEMVCIMLDQNARKEGVKMSFLGHKASVFTSPVKLTIKTGATILPVFSYRKNGKIIVEFCKPIIPKNYKNNQEDILNLTKILNLKLEKRILQNPAQWFWIHKRW